MVFKYKKLNLNNNVKVKLNEIGHREMERQHYDFYKSICKDIPIFKRKPKDEDGYSTFQVHVLMNTFGHMLTCGSELPFDDANIFIADISLEDV